MGFDWVRTRAEEGVLDPSLIVEPIDPYGLCA